ncbi:MAG TPA: M28 family metallopeptidase [Gammaproteobacteria bacterium]|nr:M28 family metallopeptidase [Gammaproteobacteria bacterium]
MRTSLIASLLLSLPLAALAAGAPQFDQANLRSTIQTLSQDSFGGRAPGSQGEQLTTDYISGKFKQYGLTPGNGSSWLQEVPMKQITADPDATLVVSGGSGPYTFAYGNDMVVSSPRTDATVALKDSPLVFVGYGIVAPEYHWNDYTGLDVKGKTVVVLVNDPGHANGSLFDGKAETYYGRWTYKYEEAARQGAAGILIVHDTEPAGYPWEVVHGSWTGPLEELQPEGGYQLAIQGWVSHASAEKIFVAAGMRLEDAMTAAAKPGFKAVQLKLDANITLHDTVKDIVSHNVVGLVKGSTHPDDVVVYSAHWDHLGMRVGADGKTQIFHGALDNGSGIAGLLEIARITAASKPQRSVLFLATTSEEQGLLGAAYYAAHPLFPLAHTVADLNMDVLDSFGKTRDMTVRGRFMSGVDEVLVAQAKSLGLAVEQDSDPAKGMYFRADHFEFAKAGVPALSIALGTDYVGHPAGWGLQQQRGYTANRYHKPADVYDPSWDLSGMVQQLDLMYATGQALADSDQWPDWKPGSPFKAKRDTERPPD